jgi:hypothetical protein
MTIKIPPFWTYPSLVFKFISLKKYLKYGFHYNDTENMRNVVSKVSSNIPRETARQNQSLVRSTASVIEPCRYTF